MKTPFLRRHSGDATSDLIATLCRVGPEEDFKRTWEYMRASTLHLNGEVALTTEAALHYADDAFIELAEALAEERTLSFIRADWDTLLCGRGHPPVPYEGDRCPLCDAIARAEKAEAEVERLREQFAHALTLLRRARHEGDDMALVELDDVLEANAEAES